MLSKKKKEKKNNYNTNLICIRAFKNYILKPLKFIDAMAERSNLIVDHVNFCLASLSAPVRASCIRTRSLSLKQNKSF